MQHTDRLFFSSCVPAELLQLENNSLFGSVPSGIGNLTSLTFFSSVENFLNMTLPTELGLLTALVELDLSLNFQTGTIPTEIGSLESLQIMRLSNNVLSGPVPTEIGNLAALGTSNVVGATHVQLCCRCFVHAITSHSNMLLFLMRHRVPLSPRQRPFDWFTSHGTWGARKH
jgi:hypothetical protein